MPTQPAMQPPLPQNIQAMQMPPSFNQVGPLGPVQHPHQSQVQHENLLKVFQIQQQQQKKQLQHFNNFTQ